MNLVYKSRIGLIRFAKVFPFILCFIVLVSLSETLFALVLSDFVVFDGGITPNTPLAWFIGEKYEMCIYSVLLAIFLSIAFETCIWNKTSEVYLLAYLNNKLTFQPSNSTPNTSMQFALQTLPYVAYFATKVLKYY